MCVYVCVCVHTAAKISVIELTITASRKEKDGLLRPCGGIAGRLIEL